MRYVAIGILIFYVIVIHIIVIVVCWVGMSLRMSDTIGVLQNIICQTIFVNGIILGYAFKGVTLYDLSRRTYAAYITATLLH